MKSKFKLIGNYPIKQYACGLTAGQKVRLIKDFVTTDHNGKPTGMVHKAGEIWEVLSGSSEPPTVVWLRRPDGKRHTWDDSAIIYEDFQPLQNET